MMKRIALLAAPLSLLAATHSAAAQPAAAQPVRVAMETELGTITLEVDPVHAPITAGNFLRYVDEKRLDGIVFYRVMRLDWGTPPNGLIQAGTRGDPKRELPAIAHEPTSVTGIRHDAGAISMARWAPGSARGDFSILLSPMHGLDADPTSPDPERAAGFAAFGHVVEGMEVARRIYDVPLSPTEGVGVMRGQMIEKPVRVLRVRRVPQPAAQPAPAAAHR